MLRRDKSDKTGFAKNTNGKKVPKKKKGLVQSKESSKIRNEKDKEVEDKKVEAMSTNKRVISREKNEGKTQHFVVSLNMKEPSGQQHADLIIENYESNSSIRFVLTDSIIYSFSRDLSDTDYISSYEDLKLTERDNDYTKEFLEKYPSISFS